MLIACAVEKTKPRRFAAPGLLFSPPSLNGLTNVAKTLPASLWYFTTTLDKRVRSAKHRGKRYVVFTMDAAQILNARISKTLVWERGGLHVRYAIALMGQERFM